VSGRTGLGSGSRPRPRIAEPGGADGLPDQHRRPRPGDEAGAEDVGLDLAAGEHLVEHRLQLGLLRRVVEAVAAAGRDRLGERLRVARVEAVGGNRGGVDETAHAGRGRRFEGVARALEIDAAGRLATAEDREGEMDGDVDAVEQRRQRAAVEDVATPVGDLLPALGRRIERPPRHPPHLPHFLPSLQLGEQGQSDLPRRPGNRDFQSHRGMLCPRL
jgi:hypothetical protein